MSIGIDKGSVITANSSYAFTTTRYYSAFLVYIGGYSSQISVVELDGEDLSGNRHGIYFNQTEAMFFLKINLVVGDHTINVTNFEPYKQEYTWIGLYNSKTSQSGEENDGNASPEFSRYSIMIPSGGISICGAGFKTTNRAFRAIGGSYNYLYYGNVTAMAYHYLGTSGTYEGYGTVSCLSLLSFDDQLINYTDNQIPALIGA